jgi:hypothetical protein
MRPATEGEIQLRDLAITVPSHNDPVPALLRQRAGNDLVADRRRASRRNSSGSKRI